MPDRAWKLHTDGMQFEVPSRLSAGALIYYQGTSEPETKQLLERVLKASDVVFDVGAHIGEYTVIAARTIGDSGRVHSFEPHPELYKILQRNVELNRIRNCTTERVALADHPGELLLDADGDLSEGHLRTEDRPTPAEKAHRVKVLTLDDYWSALGKPTVNFIKMDIEGAELLALRGAQELLRTNDDVVLLCEALEHTTKRFGYQFLDLHGLLSSLDFELFDAQDALHLRDPVPLTSFPTSGNFVALRDVGRLHLVIGEG